MIDHNELSELLSDTEMLTKVDCAKTHKIAPSLFSDLILTALDGKKIHYEIINIYY